MSVFKLNNGPGTYVFTTEEEVGYSYLGSGDRLFINRLKDVISRYDANCIFRERTNETGLIGVICITESEKTARYIDSLTPQTYEKIHTMPNNNTSRKKYN